MDQINGTVTESSKYRKRLPYCTSKKSDIYIYNIVWRNLTTREYASLYAYLENKRTESPKALCTSYRIIMCSQIPGLKGRVEIAYKNAPCRIQVSMHTVISPESGQQKAACWSGITHRRNKYPWDWFMRKLEREISPSEFFFFIACSSSHEDQVEAYFCLPEN